MELKSYMDVSEEVLQAIQDNRAIVALESPITSHGQPYPQNWQTAKRLEDIVRKKGAAPATIAVIAGRIKIGLTDEEIEFLTQSQEVIKVSRRDLPYVISEGKNGATTVASSIILASLADIEFLVTGGIEGVPHGTQRTMKTSADLQELTKTNVAVVTSGVQPASDLDLTLEYLKTCGVPVIGYGTDDFPAFYARKSGYPVNYRLDGPREVADLLYTKWDVVGIDGGVVICNPVPEAHALEDEVMESIVQNALQKAKERHITDKAATPFHPMSHTSGFLKMIHGKQLVPFIMGSVSLILLSMIPGWITWLAVLPESVIYAVLLATVMQMAGIGLQNIAKAPLDQRRITICGVSLAVGLGTMFVPAEVFQALPSVIQYIAGNGLLTGTLLAVLLEQVWKEPKNKPLGKGEGTHVAQG